MTKKFTFDDLQPHVDMLCDALENKGSSSSGVSYDSNVYTYAKRYREILQLIRNKQIGFTDLWIELRQLERDANKSVKTQRHRIAKIINALNLYLIKEFKKVNS